MITPSIRCRTLLRLILTNIFAKAGNARPNSPRDVNPKAELWPIGGFAAPTQYNFKFVNWNRRRSQNGKCYLIAILE